MPCKLVTNCLSCLQIVVNNVVTLELVALMITVDDFRHYVSFEENCVKCFHLDRKSTINTICPPSRSNSLGKSGATYHDQDWRSPV